jgi:ABC-type multidrug transport system ATPase subunit
MEEAEELCDRVAIMDRGTIAAMGAPSRLIQELLDTGYRRPAPVREATMEDVFLSTTGHSFAEGDEEKK